MRFVKEIKAIPCVILLLAVMCCLAFPGGAVAQGSEKAQKPYIYTIKKGDTLWGISERFITDPWYWPNLWANNPYIRNPHLIYPGQKVAIYDGRIELLANYPEEEAPEEEGLVIMPEPQEEISISTNADLRSFISDAGLADSGMIVDTVDDRIMMTKDDTVFVEMDDSMAEVGSRYDLYKIGDEVNHPHTGKKLGYKTTWVGALELSAAHAQVYSGVITEAVQEIERGTILLPHVEPEQEIVLQSADSVLNGTVIAGQQRQLSLAQGDVLYVDMGSDAGLQTGNMLTIVRPRTASELGLQSDGVQLPDTLLGRALVVKTDASTAAALVLKAAEPIVRGDLVYTEGE
jgi:hypothetical protein